MIDQWMSDIVAADTQSAEKRLLKGQNNGQPVHGSRETAGSFWSPGPELRRDVVQDLGSVPVRRFRYPEVETGIIHQNREIVAPDPEVLLERSQEVIVGPDFGDHFDYPERGQSFHRIAYSGARFLHVRAT